MIRVPFGCLESVIRPARVADVAEIYGIIAEAFGKSSLKFTVYQTPRSQNYIKELIERRSFEENQFLYVLERKGSILGYYHAAHRVDQWFLNYIATRPDSSGGGLGNILLRHFEDQCRKVGCVQLALDVFESNEMALSWYLRRGYEIKSRKFLIRIDLGMLPQGGEVKLQFDSGSFVQAAVQERERGFSKVCCRVGTGSVILGLIAGTTCKLLDRGDAAIDEVTRAVAHTLGRKRRFLIIGDLLQLPTSFPLERSEAILRLSKDIKLT